MTMRNGHRLIRSAIVTCVALLGLPVLSGLGVAQSTSSNFSFAGVSSMRPEFTRPGGIPGSSRAVTVTKEQYMIAPAQPADPAKPRKRKRR
jgi:hypothetical protein